MIHNRSSITYCNWLPLSYIREIFISCNYGFWIKDYDKGKQYFSSKI